MYHLFFFTTVICFKGNTPDVLATLDLITGLQLVVRNPEDDLIRNYENKLLRMLNFTSASVVLNTYHPDDIRITMETLAEIIIAAECFKLEKLLSSAVKLASRCNSEQLKRRKRYHQISNDTKFKIDQERVKCKDNDQSDVRLSCEFE